LRFAPRAIPSIHLLSTRSSNARRTFSLSRFVGIRCHNANKTTFRSEPSLGIVSAFQRKRKPQATRRHAMITAINPVTNLVVLPGQPELIGSNYIEGVGINFAIESTNATRITISIFPTASSEKPSFAFDLTKSRVKFADGSEDDVWHGLVAGLVPKPIVYYTVRVDGPNDRANGHWFDYTEELVDPGAKATTGSFVWVDGKKIAPKNIVFDNSDIDWQGFDKRIRRPSTETIIAEAHIAGFTRGLKAELGEKAGKYLGFAERVSYVADCGYTAIEFMPPIQFQEREGDFFNDWGYQPLGCYGALHAGYSSNPTAGAQRREGKILVRECHRYDLEVFFDMVFNHTAEGNDRGPLYCFRGIDNAVYYFLKPFQSNYYTNWAGCGNVVNCNSRRMIRLIIRVMKLLVREYKIDGFRFDLAKVFRKVMRTFALEQIGGDEAGLKELDAYLNGHHKFFTSKKVEDIVHPYVRAVHDYIVGGFEVFQSELMTAMEDAVLYDEVLVGIKIIAEPWDCSGNVSGSFGSRIWAEWYDKFRRAINRYWAGSLGFIGDLFYCVDGARQNFPRGKNFKMPVGYFASHDGQNGIDTCMFVDKHNGADEGGPDPEGMNCGAEGDTGDAYIIRMRWQMLKNKIITLLLSFVIPMFQLGDELGWSKKGHTNTWCRPELNDFPWWLVPNNGMRRCFKLMVQFRKRYELGGREVDGKRVDRFIVQHGAKPLMPDLSYHSLLMAGEILPFPGEDGSHIYFATNAWNAPIQLELPAPPAGQKWYRFVDTSCDEGHEIVEKDEDMIGLGTDYWIQRHSLLVLVSR
jgi:isoamylase